MEFEMDWKDWVLGVWAVFVAIPGMVSFFWNWQDRKEKKQGEKLVVNLKRSKGIPPINGFINLDISFLNKNTNSLVIEQVCLLNKKDGEIVIGDYISFSGAVKFDAEASASTLNVSIVVPPSIETEGTSIKTGSPKLRCVFLIGINAFEAGSNQIEMSFVYHSTRFKDRKIKTTVTSEPIEITAEEMANK